MSENRAGATSSLSGRNHHDHTPAALPLACATTLPRDASCAAMARRVLERFLADACDGPLLENAKMVASELVNNAFLHGAGTIWFGLEIDERRLRLEVVDEGTGHTLKVIARGDRHVEDGGRGLMMVAALAERWGALGGTTRVWAEFVLA